MANDIDDVNITRKRGDNYPFQWTLTDSSGTAVDITGYSFTMVADPASDPTDSSDNVLSLTGTLSDPTNGVFLFSPTTEEMNITPGTYFYEVQMIDASANVRTIVEGQFTIEQDIVK